MGKGRKMKLWSDMSKEEVMLLHPNDLRARDPERYKCIKQLLSEGCSLNAIARATKASQHTIEKIAASDPELQIGAAALAAKVTRLAHHAGDRLMEQLEDPEAEISAKDLAVITAVAMDKKEKFMASQTPQHQVNVQINVGEAADLNALAQGLPSNPSQPIDVEEVKPDPRDQ